MKIRPLVLELCGCNIMTCIHTYIHTHYPVLNKSGFTLINLVTKFPTGTLTNQIQWNKRKKRHYILIYESSIIKALLFRAAPWFCTQEYIHTDIQTELKYDIELDAYLMVKITLTYSRCLHLNRNHLHTLMVYSPDRVNPVKQ